MDVIEAIKGRRSIRQYLPQPVEEEKIRQILEAAQWAPSASNKQPWHFIVVRDSKTRQELAKRHSYGRWMAESPVVMVALGDPKRSPKYHLCDPHNAVMNLLLAAYSLGLSTCWMGVRDGDLEQTFKQLLGIPEAMRVICAVSVGYSKVKASSERLPLERIVSWERFGGKS
jgi:nitroreductase